MKSYIRTCAMLVSFVLFGLVAADAQSTNLRTAGDIDIGTLTIDFGLYRVHAEGCAPRGTPSRPA